MTLATRRRRDPKQRQPMPLCPVCEMEVAQVNITMSPVARRTEADIECPCGLEMKLGIPDREMQDFDPLIVTGEYLREIRDRIKQGKPPHEHPYVISARITMETPRTLGFREGDEGEIPRGLQMSAIDPGDPNITVRPIKLSDKQRKDIEDVRIRLGGVEISGDSFGGLTLPKDDPLKLPEEDSNFVDRVQNDSAEVARALLGLPNELVDDGEPPSRKIADIIRDMIPARFRRELRPEGLTPNIPTEIRDESLPRQVFDPESIKDLPPAPPSVRSRLDNLRNAASALTDIVDSAETEQMQSDAERLTRAAADIARSTGVSVQEAMQALTGFANAGASIASAGVNSETIEESARAFITDARKPPKTNDSNEEQNNERPKRKIRI